MHVPAIRILGTSGLLTLAVSAVLLLPSPPEARPATLNDDDVNLRFDAAPGESNALDISLSSSTTVFIDHAAPIQITGGGHQCSQTSASEVSCKVDYADMSVRLGDGDDSVHLKGSYDGGTVKVAGGPGNDTLTGSAGHDDLAGGPGADEIHGGRAGDTLRGGADDDRLFGDSGGDELAGGPGRDELRGGAGTFDSVTYTVRAKDPPVKVTLDGRANDGARGELDAVGPDVEAVSVTANRGGNTIVGNSAANDLELDGTGRGDTVRGGAGDDSLNGAGTIHGGPGGDDIEADGPGRFYGGPGDDQLGKPDIYNLGDRAHARMYGGPGADDISAADWYWPSDDEGVLSPFRDVVACGPGRDRAEVDGRDVVRGGCEHVARD
jgi:Ca2+-binding RTX toxin-like protein